MKKPIDMKKLGLAVLNVKRLLDEADKKVGSYSADPEGFHSLQRVEMERVKADLVEGHGAHVNDSWDGARVRLAGITSTSTSGVHGALTNWLRAAVARIEAKIGR